MVEREKQRNRLLRWRPRLTIGGMMLVIALVGLFLAWHVERARRVLVIDLGPPDVIAVGDRLHTVDSLRQQIAGSSVEQVLIRSQSNVPYSFVAQALAAIAKANVHVKSISLSSPGKTPNPAIVRPTPRIAEDCLPGS